MQAPNLGKPQDNRNKNWSERLDVRRQCVFPASRIVAHCGRHFFMNASYHASESRSYIHDFALTLIDAQMASSSFNVGLSRSATPISCVMRILRAYLCRLYFVSKCTIRNGERALHLSNLCAIAKRRCKGRLHSSEAVRFVRLVKYWVYIFTSNAQTET
jgi:hypothetical protein